MNKNYSRSSECVPFRKQYQAVEGQEWDQAMSSSSEKDEDIEKTPDSDSLLACHRW